MEEHLSEYAKKLELLSLYHLISAVRGPDEDEATQPLAVLKGELTARLRSILFIKDECRSTRFGPRYHSDIGAMWNNSPVTPEVVSRIAEAVNELPHPARQAHHHFRDHLRLAVLHTSTHPIWAGRSHEIRAALSLCRPRGD